jgi:uncharacterized membrane protein
MDYTLILALHFVAVSTWIFSMLASSIVITAFADAGSTPANPITLAKLKAWGRLVTTPAMVLTWILGATLVYEGGWLGSTWLTSKLAFVAALSAIHGIEMRTVRKLMTEPHARVSMLVRILPIVIVFFVLMVLWLATAKPFD